MKKFTLHLDAVIFLAALFLASMAGNVYVVMKLQEIQEENVDVKAGNMLYRMNTESLRTSLDDCLDATPKR